MAGGDTEYTRLITAIRNSNLSVEDKVEVVGLIERVYTEYSIAASGIAALVGLTADEAARKAILEVIARARERAAEDKPTLTPADRKLLTQSLSYLKQESAAKIISRIDSGEPGFLEMLYKKISEKPSITEEASKLSKFLGTKEKTQTL
ncbi:MAG: hypothetical protein N3H30_01775 [Candidatus Micrarchaeota archaeon]|nr:hypothetical protein [Candidatus Micrarchaeota archaeon]